MANRCYQLAIQGVLTASYRETLLNFQSSGTNDNDTVAAGVSLTNAFDASLKTLWLATIPASYSLVALAARRVDLKPSATIEKTYGVGNQLGTRGSNGTGQQTCPSIFLVPTMGVKSGGRIFWPSIPAGDLVTSSPSSGWQTAVNSFLSAAIGGITSGGITWTLAVYSRKLNTIANIASHSFSPVVGFQGKRRKPTGAV
jgi:hypothetical protein